MAARKKAAAAPEPQLEPGKKKPGRKLVAGDPELDQAEQDAIVAVKDFETAEKVLDMFKIENSSVFKTYSELLDEREQKRQVADAAVRQCNASFGPWERYSERKTYNPEVLYERVGKETFLELGGKIDKITTYSIEPAKVEVGIATKKIPEAIVADIRKVIPNYRSPK